MIKNYLRVTLRTFQKNKSYFIINGLGLGISLACCITAYMLMAFNIEFDDFHSDEKVSRIYRVHSLSKDKDGNLNRDFEAPMILASTAAEEISGVEGFTRYLSGTGTIRRNAEAFNESIAFADSSFFDLFDFPLLSGNHKSFKNKNSIFLSEELAKKYFGDEDPTGSTLVFKANESELSLQVGGVVKKLPLNNTFRFPALVRIENFMDIHHLRVDDWSNEHNPSSFLRLNSKSTMEQVNAQLKNYVSMRNESRNDHAVDSFILEPFKSTYNDNDIRRGWVNHRMRPEAIYIFAGMVLMILLIACFNLTNTSIALTSRRLKEVGVRKTIGAARRQIIAQFLFETLVTIVLSLIVGLLLAQLIVPAFTSMWNMQYGLENMNGLNLFVALIVLVFFAALVAGMYPAIVSSGFRPTTLLKGTVKLHGTNTLTRVMIGTQFALSVIVLIGGVVFLQNTRYQENIKYGYDKEMIINVNVNGANEFATMEDAIIDNHKILKVAASSGNVGDNNYMTEIKVDTATYNVHVIGSGKNYFETMAFSVMQGRALNHENASDLLEGIVVNATFVEKAGLIDPIDKIVILHDQRRRIIGVVENHVDHLWRTDETQPFVFYPVDKEKYSNLLVKAEHKYLSEVQEYLKTKWKQSFPDKPFESQFLEDVILKDSREINANLEKTFLFITILGAILSCSGIFALASLNIAKRTKEIGIRKVLGASVGSVMELLNREFVIILFLASLFGSVGGFYFTDMVLSVIYSYHISVGIAAVLACAVLIFCVGFLTTSLTIFKAARANPVNTLRNE